jgi:hypothetical protein
MKRTNHLIFGYQDRSISQYLRIQPSEYVDFPYAGWWKEREGKRRERFHSLLHSCMRGPEWNSLCWLVESESEERGGR